MKQILMMSYVVYVKWILKQIGIDYCSVIIVHLEPYIVAVQNLHIHQYRRERSDAHSVSKR